MGKAESSPICSSSSAEALTMPCRKAGFDPLRLSVSQVSRVGAEVG
jgi:hypothetical protein